jgi:hypothetical protein
MQRPIYIFAIRFCYFYQDQTFGLSPKVQKTSLFTTLKFVLKLMLKRKEKCGKVSLMRESQRKVAGGRERERERE